ncbi:MAG: type II secretion system protein [Proteobacteria bacterium]|nr:type II secretion system protein [Pseudomonadota bacterium]
MTAARSRGFTYVGLMFAIAVIGITLATIGVMWSTQIRREKEAELLWIGNQYRMAIGMYLGAGGQYPQDLSQLLEDKRFPVARRYLRKLFPDPMTGQADWQLIPAPGNGIMGVASSSQGKPIKVAGFSIRDAAFKDATCYCDWRFISNGRRLRGVRQPVAGQPD